MRYSLIVSFVVAGLTACATPPAAYQFANTRTYQRDFDQVWQDLVGFFAQRSIPVKNIAKDSGVIYAESLSFDDRFADCGDAGMLIVQGRTMTFNVFVTRAGKDPQVQVTTRFTEVRTFGNRRYDTQCNSKGVIEEQILNALAR